MQFKIAASTMFVAGTRLVTVKEHACLKTAAALYIILPAILYIAYSVDEVSSC